MARPRPDPDAVLVRDVDRAFTSTEVDEVVRRMARALLDLDLGPDRRIAVYADNSAEAVLAHLGGLRAGCSVVAVNAHLAAPEAAYQLADSGARLVFVGPEHVERGVEAAADAGLPAGSVVVWRGPADRGGATINWNAWLAAAPEGPVPDDVRPRPNLLYTSGTTGRPKATELPPNVFPRVDSWPAFLEALERNRFAAHGQHLVVAPLHHTGPLNAVRVLGLGVPVAILGRFDPEATLRAIDGWRVESTTLVPTHLQRLLALPDEVKARYDVSSLQLVFQTGAACPVGVKRAMIDWWGPVFLEAYGATEVGVTCSIDSIDWLAHPGSVGRAVPPYEAVVLDDAGAPQPPDVEGRLYFRDSTGRGIVYEGDPERTAAAHAKPGTFTLGEIGRIDPDGWVYVTDRFADMVVTGGANVYPAEMEQVLSEHPGVADVAGIGVPDDDLGEVLVALVVPSNPNEPPLVGELRAWCEARLSRYKCPRAIKLVATLDRNPLGKLDKRRLREDHAPGLASDPPR
ncbi:MAG TPA: AMP-binding protein [Acidimicrobiales bacterium]